MYTRPRALMSFTRSVGFLVIERRAAEAGDRFGAVDRAPLDRGLESFIAGLFDPRGDPLERPVPAFFFPRRAVGFAVEHFLQAPRVVHHLDARRAFAAQSAFADRMAGVALDVDYLAAPRRHDLAAADAAEGADRRRGGCAAGFERRDRRSAAGLRQGADRHRAGCKSLEKLSARWPWHRIVGRVIVIVPARLIFIFVVHLCPLCGWPISRPVI